MPLFTIHTAESAPAGSKEPLALLEQRIGFVPNLAGTMAGSPTLIGSSLASSSGCRQAP